MRYMVYRRALRAAHRYSRAINPHKIPFFLLGVQSLRRYKALGWRERVVFDALHRRWMIRKERESRDFTVANNLFRLWWCFAYRVAVDCESFSSATAIRERFRRSHLRRPDCHFFVLALSLPSGRPKKILANPVWVSGRHDSWDSPLLLHALPRNHGGGSKPCTWEVDSDWRRQSGVPGRLRKLATLQSKVWLRPRAALQIDFLA